MEPNLHDADRTGAVHPVKVADTNAKKHMGHAEDRSHLRYEKLGGISGRVKSRAYSKVQRTSKEKEGWTSS
ncbi:hypothetical protein D3C85_1799610 [compost metagenome]